MANKVHTTKMIKIDKLRVIDHNSQKQSKQKFDDLKKNISEEGFDENLIVRTLEDGTFEVVSGNHRFRAAKDLGFKELPCVVRDDWDEVKAQLQSVRRNFGRGDIDKNLFTEQVNALHEQGVAFTDIIDGMGFADMDEFASLYKDQQEKEKAAHAAMAEEASQDVQVVKMIDDLGAILSSLIDQYGHTIPNSFIIFPVGGKNHLYIAANNSLKKNLQQVATACVQQGMDINVALAGLLSIGLSQTNFLTGSGKKEISDLVDEEYADIEVIK